MLQVKVSDEDISLLEKAGFNPSVSRRVAEIISSGKTRFGVAGASLTHQATEKTFGARIVDGIEGEKATSKVIQEWAKGKSNVVLFNSAHIKGWGSSTLDEETGLYEGGDTDHVLLMGDKVVLIDSKRWKSKRKYEVSDKGTVLRSGRSFPGGAVQADKAKHLWKRFFIKRNKIVSYVCVASPKTFVVYNRNWFKQGYKLITLENLHSNLDKEYRGLESTPLDIVTAIQIASSLVKPRDKIKELFGEKGRAILEALK